MPELLQMFELAKQSRRPSGAGAGKIDMIFNTAQHSRYEVLANRMYAHLANTSHEIDRGTLEVFCKRVLAITFLDWMCKPEQPAR
jgi:hypothetical protein